VVEIGPSRLFTNLAKQKAKQNVVLSWPKHLYCAARSSTPSGAMEMLRQAQHDVLVVFFFIPKRTLGAF